MFLFSTIRQRAGFPRNGQLLGFVAVAAISQTGCKAHVPWHQQIYAVSPMAHQISSPGVSQTPSYTVPVADDYPTAPLGGEGLSGTVSMVRQPSKEWPGSATVDIVPLPVLPIDAQQAPRGGPGMDQLRPIDEATELTPIDPLLPSPSESTGPSSPSDLTGSSDLTGPSVEL